LLEEERKQAETQIPRHTYNKYIVSGWSAMSNRRRIVGSLPVTNAVHTMAEVLAYARVDLDLGADSIIAFK